MKIINTDTQTFGPFHTVEELPDRYRCNSELDLQYDVIGPSSVDDAPEGVLLQSDSEKIETLKLKIKDIEDSSPVTLRAQREQALVIREIIRQATGEYPDTYGFNKAVELETEIAAFRAQISALGG